MQDFRAVKLRQHADRIYRVEKCALVVVQLKDWADPRQDYDCLRTRSWDER